jgi:hopanoid biosynthesis associated RND transporter like protein HpnN
MTTQRDLLARLVAACARRPRLVVVLGLLLGIAATTFVVTHFSLSSDTEQLIAHTMPWRVREATFNRLFQPEGDQIVTVVDGATPEIAEAAAEALTAKLQARPDLFRLVRRPDASPFFQQEGLLYEDAATVRSDMAKLIAAQPFLGPLAADPSLRGLAGVLQTAATGVQTGQASFADLRAPMTALAGAVEGVRAGKPTFFSWRALISGKAPPIRERRFIVLASPVLNFAKLLSGADASGYIRAAARGLNLDAAHGVRVRLTGPVPLQDEEFATLGERAGLIATLASTAIIAMLWFAVRSVRLIAAILVTTIVGLVCAAAIGLLIFHRFNVISVAFIPLFVGLGIDFGIQFSVRFRAEHQGAVGVGDALDAAGVHMGRSLALAATAIASGFLAFAPTDYVGVSQLGVIAGCGMFIALLLSLTVLPALIAVLGPPPARFVVGENALLTRIDTLILSRRRWVLIGAGVLAVISAAALPWLRFDFNPIHMKSAKVESVATLFDLMSDPNQSPNTLELIAPSLAVAQAKAASLARLSTVSETRTLASFVPDDQPEKLAAIADAATLLDLTLDPIVTAPPPSDADNVAALRQAAAGLRAAASSAAGADAASALRLAADFDWLATAPTSARDKVTEVLIPGLETLLRQTSTALSAQPVTLQSLPPDLARDWMTPSGLARVSILPRGDANDTAVLERFIAQVKKVEPEVTGSPLDLQEGGRTVADAFLVGGVLSFAAITVLLFAVLRRPRDVAITMAPIVLTGLLTLGTCVAIGQALNFANIIALPLLFGIGVAFHIYFVMAWRGGEGHLLESSLTRGIFFSAMATATGFGSLWASSHPGTASMGKLLMISLVWTLVSALIFQPALMGTPGVPKRNA